MALDELLADFLAHTGAEFLPSKTPILTLMQWSYSQTVKPDKLKIDSRR